MKISNNKEKEKEFLKQIQSVKKFDIIIEGIVKRNFSNRRDEAINTLFKMANEGLLPEDVSHLLKDIKKVDISREKFESAANNLIEQLYSLLNQKYKVDFDFIELLQDIQQELECRKEEVFEAEPTPPVRKRNSKLQKKVSPDFDMREIIINPKEGFC
ncbi:hypothetical protein LLG10_01020 [bacterium]|nr:hypothetical protein [bacterium]